ncbi:hypothetical protein CVT24_007618 [Panaeolus cyanescens]|uniref:Uncharacterized protein n=1 Tax=Panaeolus cyanescens TaxID=181874 RepID=A0A409YKG7_9AGAR|nr:hypothetical protein CVT24_007618 [Panaeolus cyanescens]
MATVSPSGPFIVVNDHVASTVVCHHTPVSTISKTLAQKYYPNCCEDDVLPFQCSISQNDNVKRVVYLFVADRTLGVDLRLGALHASWLTSHAFIFPRAETCGE